MKWAKCRKLLISTVIFIALLEICSLMIFHFLPDNIYLNGKSIVNKLQTDTIPADFSIISHPYMLYYNAPEYKGNGFKQYNSKGYRNTYEIGVKDSHTFRVLCIGASTTNGYPYVTNPQHAWPSQLETLLQRKYPQLKIEVINAGLPFATSAEFLAGYIFRHRYLKADLIILEAGGNDILSGMYENYNPELTHLRSHGNNSYPRKGERFLLHSSFIKLVYTFWLNEEQSVFRGVPYHVQDLDKAKALDRVSKCDFEGFSRNIDLLGKIILQDSSSLIMIPFVEVPKNLISKKEPLLKGLEDAQDLGYSKVRNSLFKASNELNVPLIPLSFENFELSDFIDLCHLNEKGELKKATLIFEGLDSLNIIGVTP